MKVYGHPISTATRQIFALLAEKGLRAELVVVDVSKGEQGSPAHLSRHPFGHIPVLEDDGFWLYETHAILRYLERKSDMPVLIPSETRDLARLDQWLSIEQSYFEPAGKKLFAKEGARLFGAPPPDDELLAQGKQELGHLLEIMAKRLQLHPYLAGDQFSLADLCLFTDLARLIEAEDVTHSECEQTIATSPSLRDWWTRLEARSSWAHARRALAA